MQAILLLEHPDYKTAYHTIKNNLAKKGQRSVKDPQGSTCEDTVDQTQYASLCEHLISLPDAAAARNRSIYTNLVASVGRADEGRLTYLPDLMSPRLCGCIGNFSQMSSQAFPPIQQAYFAETNLEIIDLIYATRLCSR